MAISSGHFIEHLTFVEMVTMPSPGHLASAWTGVTACLWVNSKSTKVQRVSVLHNKKIQQFMIMLRRDEEGEQGRKSVFATTLHTGTPKRKHHTP
jgi:hypothetical protein